MSSVILSRAVDELNDSGGDGGAHGGESSRDHFTPESQSPIQSTSRLFRVMPKAPTKLKVPLDPKGIYPPAPNYYILIVSQCSVTSQMQRRSNA